MRVKLSPFTFLFGVRRWFPSTGALFFICGRQDGDGCCAEGEDFPSVRHGKHTELATPIKQSRTYAAVTAEHKTHLS